MGPLEHARPRLGRAMIGLMLATRERFPAPATPGWALEPKIDGARVLVRIEDSGPAIWTREGQAVTRALPELVRAIGELALEAGTVLDCELWARGPDGRISVSAALGCLSRRRGPEPRLAVFDLPAEAGPWTRRRALLERLVPAAGLVARVPARPLADLEGALRAVERHGLEGLVAKATDSPYRAGRSDRWRKWRAVWGPPQVSRPLA